jgi:hypothetical protein
LSEEHPAQDGAPEESSAAQPLSPSSEPPPPLTSSEPSAPVAPRKDSGTTESGYSYTVVDAPEPAEKAPKPKKEKTPSEPLRIGPGLLAALILVPAAIAGVLVWFFASAFADDGGGGGGDRTNANVASVIHAFSQGEPGSTRRIEGELPPGLPDEIPQYPGSNVVSSLINVAGDNVVYLVIYDTEDDLDEVGAYFTEALDEDRWQLEGSQDGQESSLRQFTKVDDADVEGVYLLAESKDADVTTIFLSVQVTSGADETELDEFEPEVSKSVPDGFPDEIPQYPDGRVIETGFQRQTQGTRYSISMITRDNNTSVLDFYRDAFEEMGWTVEDADASDASTLEDAVAITFEGSGGDINGNVVAGEFAEDANYTRVDVNVFEP